VLDLSAGEIDNVVARLPRFYRTKSEPKPDGGQRIFYIPQGRLRDIQNRIQTRILSEARFPRYLHGGIRRRSALTNARRHCGKGAVLALDIRQFFPHIRPARVTAVFERLGYAGQAARILTALTTFKHQLPQGPPTSPAIANLCIPRADARLSGIARTEHFEHTRFMDDMTLSGSKRLAKFARLAARAIEEEAFVVKQGPKGKLMLQSEAQRVTGLGLNFRVNVSRPKRQAILSDSVEMLKAGQPLDQSAQGRLGWVNSVNPRVASRVVRAVKGRRNSSRL
jgi:RNA-directed DNA polymerase